MTNNSQGQRFLVPLAIIVLVGTLLSVSIFRNQQAESDNALVVYCAHDAVFSTEILDRFERETGVKVTVRFDEEASKSLGLLNQILGERKNPRCDVFWNNQLFNTLQLKDAGLLEPYKGPGYERIPDRYKDADGLWTGFAGRLRVFIVNTDRMECSEDVIRERLAGDLRNVSIGKLPFGTTRSHYAVLWQELGEDTTKQWHRGLHQRSVREVQGNSTVRNLVQDAVCDFGFTDTDDFFGAVDKDKPVQMLPVRLESGATICIPNTVCIIRGTKRREQAERLVDFLLSADVELALAASSARQIPLGPVDEAKVPDDVKPLRKWASDSYELMKAAPTQGDCLDWLKSEYLQ